MSCGNGPPPAAASVDLKANPGLLRAHVRAGAAWTHPLWWWLLSLYIWRAEVHGRHMPKLPRQREVAPGHQES